MRLWTSASITVSCHVSFSRWCAYPRGMSHDWLLEYRHHSFDFDSWSLQHRRSNENLYSEDDFSMVWEPFNIQEDFSFIGVCNTNHNSTRASISAEKAYFSIIVAAWSRPTSSSERNSRRRSWTNAYLQWFWLLPLQLPYDHHPACSWGGSHFSRRC